MTRIAYIGNFAPERSTENALCYGLRAHGIDVTEYPQEGLRRHHPATWAQRTAAAGYDAVLYTRSHVPSALDRPWTRAWRHLEDHGILTASYHLDVFVGLRRAGMAQPTKWRDPLFTTGTVITPDPALAELITTDRTRHVWMPPAADVRDDDPEGTAREDLAGKVIFVGSRYGTAANHPQYPFRAELLTWLETTLADRFIWYGPGSPRGTIRGKGLWDIYASDAVIVGDSCFAGERPGYWSDRIPETLAHGGLLLHPYIEGLTDTHPHVTAFPYQPLEGGHLLFEIEYALGLQPPHLGPDSYRDFRANARAHTRAHHTYVHRAHQLLTELGLEPETCQCPSTIQTIPR